MKALRLASHSRGIRQLLFEPELNTFVSLMTHPHLSQQIILKNKEERRILDGHLWVFSNEIRETLGDPRDGDVVEIVAANGLTIGVGLYNAHSLIRVRLLARHIIDIDHDFFRKRISEARDLRKRLYPHSSTFRVIYGESDFLPGLIVDRYNEYLAVQTLSYGMDARLATICDVLEELFTPAGIVERNESPLRDLEGLEQRKGILRGTSGPTIITEYDIHYQVNPLEGQKTGFFLDQRENRFLIRRFSADAAILDCFCNEGGFALNAAVGGASSVIAIDSSEEAIARARHNAALNGLSGITFEQHDIFERVASLGNEGALFDVVILDPPSFTRTRKNVPAAKKGYRDLHRAALKVLKRGGILLSASCSHHIEPGTFMGIILDAAAESGRSIQLLDWRGASSDHPVLPAMAETRYLKFAVCSVL